MEGTSRYQKISVSLPPDTLEALDRYCERKNRSRSSAVQEAIEHYLENDGFDIIDWLRKRIIEEEEK